MGAQSATGTGLGACGKVTTKELSILANGPSVLIAGVVAVSEALISPTSPPTSGNNVTFETPFEFGPDRYVVMLTPIGAEYAYVGNMFEDDDGKFSGFSVLASTDCDVMYVVYNRGVRPSVA